MRIRLKVHQFRSFTYCIASVLCQQNKLIPSWIEEKIIVKTYKRKFLVLKFKVRFSKNHPARDIPQILLLLGHFVIKKLLIKNCWHFLKNFMSTLKLSFNTFWNFTEDITHWKNFQILISKTLKISYLGKKCFFYDFSKILEFNLPLNRQVLTKCWLKYSRSIRNLLLMFFIFWIMIISPKLKKIFDGTDPPPKKRLFFGGSIGLK